MIKGLLPIVHTNNGCDYHRIFLPLKYMGFDFKSHFEKGGINSYEGVGAVIFNRLPLNPIQQVVEHKKKYGFKIILDMDDSWELNNNHILWEQWKKDKFAENFIYAAKNADVITTTTTALADKLRILNKDIHVIPNALPFGYEQFNDSRTDSDDVRFMYAGGSSHLWDLRLLSTPFAKLNGYNLTNIKFVLAGYSDSNLSTKKLWDKMEGSFNLNGKLRGYVRQGTLPLDSYMDHYKNADISLVPLETNLFTAYKSNLKILEAGCKRIPVITSNTSPYSDEPNKDSIMYAGNTADWVKWVRKCHRDAGFRHDKGQELGEYVRKHYDLFKINEYRKQLFHHILTT